MPRKKKPVEEYKGFKLFPQRPRGMSIYSVKVIGPKVRAVLQCRSRTRYSALECGKFFIDDRIEEQKGRFNDSRVTRNASKG